MRKKRFRPSGLRTLALVLALCAVAASPFLTPAYAKNGSDKDSRVYNHSFDEVFQAAQDAMERMGLSVTAKDKARGTINSAGDYLTQCGAGPCKVKMSLEVLVETVSPRPQTRLTINYKRKTMITGAGTSGYFKSAYLSELQKVLATYK